MRLAPACLALLLLAASPLAAGENSWTPIPHLSSNQIPGEWILTGDPAITYAEHPLLGLHRSSDGGRHWIKLEAPSGPLAFEIDPEDPETVFAATDQALLRSTDGGRSWLVVLDPPPADSFEDDLQVLVSAHFPGRVYAATRRALWRSTDGGLSFVRRGDLPGEIELTPRFDLQEAADGGLYLHLSSRCGEHGCGADFWRLERSADQGQSWIAVSSGQEVTALAAVIPHPTRPESVYLFAKSRRLSVSDDRGATLTEQAVLPAGRDLFIDASLPDTLFATGLRTLERSDDRGLTWRQLSLPIDPTDPNRASFGHASPGRLALWEIPDYQNQPLSAVIYESSDGGSSWNPLPVESPFVDSAGELAVSGDGGGLYLFDHTGRILSSSRDGGASWQNTALALALFTLTGDSLSSDTVYAAGLWQDLYGLLRSRDGGQTFELVLNLPFATGVYDLVILRQGETTTLVAALTNGEVARSADGGASWQVGPPQMPGGEPDTFRRIFTDGVRVYGVTAFNSDYYQSADGGASWIYRGRGSSSLAGGGGLLARLAGDKIESSTTGGATWESRDLPFPIGNWGLERKLVVDSQGAFYLLGRDVLLRSRDRGRSWQSLSQGLPATTSQVYLVADPADKDHLYLGSGSGLYQATYRDPAPLALVRGRFEARVRWRGGPTAPWIYGEVASISDQSGVFRLFSPERAEVAVQILDGRVLGGRFWTFVASMTDVELEVEVKDRQTGDTWLHHQEAGQATSTADFAVFPRENQPTGGALPQPFGGFAASLEVVTLAGRFEVSASRPAPYAFPPRGRQLFGDTAGFTFFDPGAIDLVVNVIDGRPLNGKWWVFAGSLTDQEFVITVRDTVTGAVKTYPNPAGGFAGFGDTDAF